LVDDLSLFKAELPNGGARLVGAEVSVASLDAGGSVPVKSDELPSSSAISLGEEPKLHVDLEVPATIPPVENAPKVAVEQPTKETDLPTSKAEMFVVIYVLALGEPFLGQGLVDVLLDNGMTFGEMDIFHKLDKRDLQLFSLASAVEPGRFNLSSIDQFSTPGVSLFMRVHEVGAPLQVLDSMLSVANSIAQKLNGEVRDETRSVMTAQTIEHCRQSITEFLFKHSA
jgi:cell division protein ZipA